MVQRLAPFFLTLTLCMNSAASSQHAEQMDSRRSTGTNEQIPVIEDYQPKLKPGQIWMGLPDTVVAGLQGDYVNIPIKVAAGPNTSKEITLAVDLLKRSNQKIKGEDFEVLHWLNGYTKNKCNLMILAPGSSHLTMHSTRINGDIPLSKFLRIRLPENAPEGVFLLKFSLFELNGTKPVSTAHVRVAVIAGMQWGAIPVSFIGNEIQAEVRDREGLPRSGDLVLLKGVKPNSPEVFVQLKPRRDDDAIHVAPVPSNWSDYTWTLIIENRGFPQFNRPLVELITKQ